MFVKYLIIIILKCYIVIVTLRSLVLTKLKLLNTQKRIIITKLEHLRLHLLNIYYSSSPSADLLCWFSWSNYVTGLSRFPNLTTLFASWWSVRNVFLSKAMIKSLTYGSRSGSSDGLYPYRQPFHITNVVT